MELEGMGWDGEGRYLVVLICRSITISAGIASEIVCNPILVWMVRESQSITHFRHWLLFAINETRKEFPGESPLGYNVREMVMFVRWAPLHGMQDNI